MDPLYVAVCDGELKLVESLLTDDSIDEEFDGRTLMHIAAEKGYEEIVNLLCQRHPRLMFRVDKRGDTPINLAFQGNHLGVVKLLLNENEATVYLQDYFLQFPLHMAAEKGHVQMLDILLKTGAYVDLKGTEDKTPLHFAAEFSDIRVIKMLVHAGANIHALSMSSETPLHIAAAAGRPSIVRYLLDMGADPRARCDDNLFTTLHEALDRGRKAGTWNVSSEMFENILKVTKMLLIACSYRFDTDDLEDLMKYACKIRIVEEELEDNIQQIKFSPEILRCLLNYVLEVNYLKSVTFAFQFKIPRMIGVLVQYDIFKSNCRFELDCEIHRKSIIDVLDHITDSGSLFDSFMSNISIELLDIAKIVIARIVLIKITDVNVNDDCFNFYERYKLPDWYRECKRQVKNMQETKIHSQYNVTYYDILSKHVCELACYVENEYLLETLESSYMKFPAYAEFLERSVEEGKERRDLIDSSTKVFLNAIQRANKFQLPSLVLKKLFSYLSEIDLRRILAAGGRF